MFLPLSVILFIIHAAQNQIASSVSVSFEAISFFVQATPMLGAVCVLLCVFVVHEPKRGAIERGENPNALSASNVHNTSSWLTDLKYIATV